MPCKGQGGHEKCPKIMHGVDSVISNTVSNFDFVTSTLNLDYKIEKIISLTGPL